MISATVGGSSASQPAASATASRSPSRPNSPHSWISGPLIWAAEGGFPDMARDLSTVMAVSPPPPATAKSCQP
jgi:hypothetical protein